MTDVRLSLIDERRFGIRTARANRLAFADLPEILTFCRKNSVSLLIARCLSTDLKAAQAMEAQGFFLTDTLVYYKRDIQRRPIPSDDRKVLVRPFRPGEEDRVRNIAVRAFQGYFGHYHADPKLESEKCDAAYTSWAVRSCLSVDAQHEVLVAEWKNSLAGFATVQLNTAEEGEGVLFGIAPWAQGVGLYRSMMIEGMLWCLSKGATSMVVSTQITNIAVQKVWVRLGFELNYALYTFHKWFDVAETSGGI